MNNVHRIEDNNILLERMMTDFWAQDSEHQADKFWKTYESENLNILRDRGLTNFLSRSNSFGNATGREYRFPRLNRYFRRISDLCRALKIKSHPFYARDYTKTNPDTIRQLFGTLIFEILYTTHNGNQLFELNDDLLGDPEETFEVGGKTYSLNFVNYFHRALMMEKYLHISNSTFLLEIGAGYGGQAEILLKMFPKLKVCLTDIPPQLYVIEQYLKSLFPGEVLGYEDTTEMQTIDSRNMGKNRVAIIAPWELNKIEDNTFENFTNQASFQEMSHDTVRRYCDELHRLVKNGIFLYEQREGCGGVTNPVTKNEYIRFLHEFDLVHDVTTLLGGHLGSDPSRPLSHNDVYVFKRK